MTTGAPPVLEAAFSKIGQDATRLFMDHLRGGTSANYLSDWLGRAGAPVSATTIKEYRRAVQNGDR